MSHRAQTSLSLDSLCFTILSKTVLVSMNSVNFQTYQNLCYHLSKRLVSNHNVHQVENMDHESFLHVSQYMLNAVIPLFDFVLFFSLVWQKFLLGLIVTSKIFQRLHFREIGIIRQKTHHAVLQFSKRWYRTIIFSLILSIAYAWTTFLGFHYKL